MSSKFSYFRNVKLAQLLPVLFIIALLTGIVDPQQTHAADLESALLSATDDFVITVKTNNPGTSSDTEFTIPTYSGETYNYNVDCGGGGATNGSGVTGDYTCSYSSANTYTIRISDNSGTGTGFPRIYFNNGGDKDKLLTIEQWGTGQWTSMNGAFYGCSNLAGQASDTPNLSNVTDLSYMFNGASAFNQDIGNWETANIVDMSNMFQGATTFNQDIGSWNTANLVSMRYMFQNASAFNQNIDGWSTTTVENMTGVFHSASAFNQDIGSWNTSNVANMTGVFFNASAFNQDIGNWDTAKVTNMNTMFFNATAFDQDIGSWDVSAVQIADNMFFGVTLSTTNYDALLIGWDAQTLQNGVTFSGGNSNYCDGETARANMTSSDNWIIYDGGKSCIPKPEMGVQRPVPTNISDGGTDNVGNQDIGTVNLTYTIKNTGTAQLDVTGVTASNFTNSSNFATSTSFPLNIAADDSDTIDISFTVDTAGAFSLDLDIANNDENEDPYDITVSGTGVVPPDNFVITVKTDNSGSSSNTQFTIPTTGSGYNYNVDCDLDGSNEATGQTGNYTCDYGSGNEGTYTVMISGDFPRIYFNNGGDKDKLLTIEQWGTEQWTSMNNAFYGCSNLAGQASDAPDLSLVTDMSGMFRDATSFNQNISNWNTAAATNMSYMFSGASAFNQNIGSWNTAAVTNMSDMFNGATAFDQDIGSWNVEAMTNAATMFNGATLSTANYDALLNGWDAQSLQSSVTFDGGNSNYCFGEVARNNMETVDTWTITDGGKHCVPEIDVQRPASTSIANEGTDNVGDQEVGIVNLTYTIENTGGSQLDVTGVTASNFTNSSGFSSSTSFPLKIAAGTTDTIDISFDVGAAGAFSLDIDLANNDGDENPYTITIQGTGIVLTDDFVITVQTDNSGASSDTQFTIPTTEGGYNYNVDCDNDGTDETTGETGNYTCSYPSSGTYTIRIKDNTGLKTGFPRIYFNDNGDKDKILSVEQWGTGIWTSMESAFRGCSNLIINASDTPDLSGVTDLSYMFFNAGSLGSGTGNWAWNTASVTDLSWTFAHADTFNKNIGSWNVSNVTDMYGTFWKADTFNQNISSWNVSNVTDMRLMFREAFAFNQNISGWNVSSVTNMASMFYNADAFNQNIGGWTVGNVTDMSNMFRDANAFNQAIGGWDVSSVTNMSSMFEDTPAFNQALGSWVTSNVTDMSGMFSNTVAFNQDIGSWDTGKVTDMSTMFASAAAFDQNIGGWDVSALTNATDMFAGLTLSLSNYDALLIGWDAQTLQNGVTFSGGNSTYCTGATARSNMISSDAWGITDGGLGCLSMPEIDVQGNDTSIANGDSTPAVDDDTDFWYADVNGGLVEHTFTIKNTGDDDLTITVPLTINGANANNFTITDEPDVLVPSSGSTTFTVEFDPDAEGLREAEISIINNDSDETPYTFAIQGKGGIPSFDDVPVTHPRWAYIEALYREGYTAGCGGSNYCPDTIMNRAMSAVFMLRGQFGIGYTPPPEPWDTFGDDWSPGPWAEKWAQGMWDEGLSSGCGGGNYCPWDMLPRVQASVFGLRLKFGNSYSPPPASGNILADMTDTGYWGTKWAEQAYLNELLPECGWDGSSGKPLFCPDEVLDRSWGAYLIVKAKDLPLP